MEGYKTTLDIQTRFRDTDAMGHINNAVYLSYLELARMEYMKEVLGVTDYNGVDFILARAEIDFKSQAKAGDALTVGARVTALGGASFTMDYRVVQKGTSRLVAVAKSVQVAYDYKGGKVKRVSSEFRRKVREHDGIE